MQMIVSRTSDEFMDRQMLRNYPPCKGARWDDEKSQWLIDIGSVKQLAGMAKGDSVRLVICQDDRGLPHLQIDDISGCW